MADDVGCLANMLRFIRALFSPAKRDQAANAGPHPRPEPPKELSAPGVKPFAFRSCLQYVDGLPVPDWEAVSRWLDALPSDKPEGDAWASCVVAWLQHLGAALGPDYRLSRAGDSILLSSLDDVGADATLKFMNKTQERILRVLGGIAVLPRWGQNILLVVDDHDTYYRYVSRYYEEDGEFAGSSGMHINAGCSHYVAIKADLRSIEPVIAHEMTHGLLGHLPIPAWLNEGIAVNTEQRLCPPLALLHTPQEMHEKHLHFWGEGEIQEFWSGKSFRRVDDGNMLSYDLGRILVSQFSADWERFRAFVLAADLNDAGAAAAREHLGVDLGAAVAALFERDGVDWGPEPSLWQDAPEKGAFRDVAR